MLKTFTLRSLGILFTSLFFYPLSVSAAAPSSADISAGFGTFGGLVASFNTNVVTAVSTLLLSLALIAFFWGIVEYVWGVRGGDAKKVSDGNKFIGWALLGLFVMFSVYGIIKFGQGILFNGKDVSSIVIPKFIFDTNGSSDRSGAFPSPSSSLDRAGVFPSPGASNTQSPAQAAAQQAANATYSSCVSSGKTESQCESAYQAAGGSGSGKQNTAQATYNSCIGGGSSSLFVQTDCEARYRTAGGTGSPKANLAQEAYSTCLSAGNSESECLPAYRTYLGDPNASAPATQANQNGICPAGYVADDSASSGCSRVSPLGGGANSSTSGIHDYNSCVLAGGEQDTCRQSYPTFETQAGEDAYQLMRNSNPNAQDQINCQDSGGTPVVDADRQYVRCDMGNGDTSAPVLIQDTTPSPSAGSDSCQQDPHAWFCPGNDIPSTE